jgi:hypothetical protein
MFRVLLIGPPTLTAGGLVIAVSFLTHQPLDVRVLAAAVGFVLVASGAGFTLVSMHQILRSEVSLVVRSDGVVVQSDRSELVVEWPRLQGARWDAARSELVVEREGGEPIGLGRALTAAQAARAIDAILQAKRRAEMNLPL